MKQFYKGTNDQVFKAIFCKESNRGLLKRLIEDALSIKDIEIINVVIPELPKDNIYIHGKILDVVVKLKDCITNIELNVYNDSVFHRRNFAYMASQYSNNLKVSAKYSSMNNFIQLNITVSDADIPPFDIYRVKGDNFKKLFIDNFTIYEFNLTKMLDKCYNSYEFIKMLNYDEADLNKKCVGDKDMEKYNSEIHRVNDDPEFVEFLSYEEDSKQYMNTIKALEYEQCVEEGSINEKKEIAKKMIDSNIAPEDIAKYTGLTVDEVKSLKEANN